MAASGQPARPPETAAVRPGRPALLRALRSWWQRHPYKTAAIAVLLLVPPGYPLFLLFDRRFPLQYFLLGVAFAAWNGGLKPGVLATVLGAFAGLFLFLPGRGQGVPTDVFDVARLTIYSLIGVTISFFSEVARRRAARLEAALAVKNVFLANMTHELRTPLTGVLGFADLLHAEQDLTSAQQALVAAVRRNGRNLQKLVDDVLDLTQGDGGKLRPAFSAASPAELLRDVHGRSLAAARAKGLELVLALDPALPPTLLTDAARLLQILDELVGNAIKFTDAGAVTIAADVSPSPAAPMREIAVRIVDSGIGVSAAQRELVFEPFVQGDMTTTRRFGGAGLGLALARQRARVLGGDVRLERSVPGQGSTFLLTLPLATGA